MCVPTSSSVKTGVEIERALALPPSQVIIGWDPPARGAGGPETPIFNLRGCGQPLIQLAPGGGGEEEVERRRASGLAEACQGAVAFRR